MARGSTGRTLASKDGPVLTGGFGGNPFVPMEPLLERVQPPRSDAFKDIAVWGKKLAPHLAVQVKKGLMTVEDAAAKLMDKLHERVGLSGNMTDTINKMEGMVKTLEARVVDNFKNLPSGTFDLLWAAQNPQGDRRLATDDIKTGAMADGSVALIEQLRLAGKIPGLSTAWNLQVMCVSVCLLLTLTRQRRAILAKTNR